MKQSRYKLLLLTILFGLVLSGCTAGMANRFQPASHFVHPNSNVKILGPVHVSLKSGISIMLPPPVRTAEMDKKLYQMALAQQSGADVIVDFVVTAKITMYPLYITFYKVEYILDGMAAKKIVGKQELI